MRYSRAVLAALVAVLFLAAPGCSQQPTGSQAVDAAKLKIRGRSADGECHWVFFRDSELEGR